MELTISQIGSSMSHWVARSAPPASGALRAVAPATSQPADSVPVAPVSGLRDLETEYDQFGRFGVNAANAAEIAEATPSPAQRPGINANKHLRSGKATAYELEQEYGRSLVDTYAGAADYAERRFIPSGMTEYQVYQLQDYQYRWAIEAERQALARPLAAEGARDDASASCAVTDGPEPHQSQAGAPLLFPR